MANQLPKWTDERTEQLVQLTGDVTPVTQDLVATIAATMETTTRSISSKLRKMNYDVELASAVAKGKNYTPEQEAALEALVTDNTGVFTYAELAEQFGQGFSAKQIQGKILSMELTSHVRPTPKVEAVKSYTDAEEATFIEMAAAGSFLEEIAAALGKELNSARGKALSLLRADAIDCIPKQRDTVSKDKVDAFDALGDVSALTVEDIAAKLEKTVRGVKTMLTRRGVTVSNYDGAAKKAKSAASAS